jgi:hypothetical protein
MTQISISDTGSVIVDGIEAGSPAEAIARWPQHADQIKAQRAEWDRARPDRASEPSPPTLRTFRADIFRRATRYEAELIELALNASSAKYRNMFRDVLYLDHTDPLFTVLRNSFIDAFGEARADELLAPSK